MRHSAVSQVVVFVALFASALAMGAALAHALELPNKIELSADEYFIVQKAYRGWDRLAILLVVQLLALVAMAVTSRNEPGVMWPAMGAIVFLLAAQAVFWRYTYPANAATENWTVVPANWETLRAQWEHSHAIGAACQTLTMACAIIAALRRQP